MTQVEQSVHAWWSRLRHQGLLLSPVVLVERYPDAPTQPPFWVKRKLRDDHTQFLAKIDPDREGSKPETAAVLAWVDKLLEDYVGLSGGRLAKQGGIPPNMTATVKIGARPDTLRPHRVIYADCEKQTPAILVMADESPRVGRGRGRTAYARFLELLRATGQRLGLLTNGLQFRLIYAGIDFESWTEWESDRWFDDGEGSEELAGFRQLFCPESLAPNPDGTCGLLDAVEESRKKQADLSNVLRENVRQAVEFLLEEVSKASRTSADLLAPLAHPDSARPLTDKEAHEALLQATVRIVMRMVVCLFAESRGLLPVDDPIYSQSYGVRTLYELLDDAQRNDGGTYGLANRANAWPRLMALFRLIHQGSAHGAFPLKAYGGALFRSGDAESDDAVLRALHILAHDVTVCDATIYQVLRKLLRGPLPVIRGRSKTHVDGPVDYTDLRTEFIGLIYEGLLDYQIHRTGGASGIQIFLNIGREPVLPLARLEDMLEHDAAGLKDLLTKLRKEKATASAGSDDSADEDGEAGSDDDSATDASDEEIVDEEPLATSSEGGVSRLRADFQDAEGRARSWARKAALVAGLALKKKKKESQSEYDQRLDEQAAKLIQRVIPEGEFYLVRAGNTRKGTGTFYTRPQLAVPTVHRTLEPLCYDKTDDGLKTPKPPEDILALKVCDPACGSASFLVAALHYLTDALYESLRVHRRIEDPAAAKRLALPFGRPRKGDAGEEIIPFPPDDPHRGDHYPERIKALLRRHVVERCIYGVDINPLAVEFARVSLWIETLDPELPLSFLDHKIKVGNALVGCWLDRVQDYPLKAWERNGGDDEGKKTGPRTDRIETMLKGPRVGKRRDGDGIIKKEMRELIADRFQHTPPLFGDMNVTTDDVVARARADYERLHSLPMIDPDGREAYYQENVENSPALIQLRQAMDEWCAVWFWPMDEASAAHVPTPHSFHARRPETAAIIRRLAGELRFFHWEIEFPDVFSAERRGFDATVGNPPWETVQQESMEFFSEFDPIYRTYGKQVAINRQIELFEIDRSIQSRWLDYTGRFAALGNWFHACAEPFDISLGRDGASQRLSESWSHQRTGRRGYADPLHPFRHQGTGKTYTYKLFTEAFYRLLSGCGRLGVIVPSSLYTDHGSKTIRSLFLDESSWEWLFSFENRKKVFEIDERFKFAAVIVSRAQFDRPMFVAFMVHDLAAWERPDPPVFEFDRGLIPLFSPRSKSLPEVRTQRDLEICRKIYDHSIRIGDGAPGWQITYAQEFNMTSDSKHFPPIEKWKAKGFKPDVFGRWIGPDGEVALPLYEGRMIGQFDFSEKGWVSGKGRTAKWREIPFDAKTIEPQYLMTESDLSEHSESSMRPKLAFMDITSATNARTMIAVLNHDVPFGNSAPTLTLSDQPLDRLMCLAGMCNSIAFDFAVRQRAGGLHLNWFIIEECPIAAIPMRGPGALQLRHAAAKLSLIHRRFAPDWLKLLAAHPELKAREWKHWWAVTEADRLRLRVEIDALAADLYGLSPDDFDWIVRDDPTDPKGFWRVDKTLPFRERLTGLAAVAFRALKEGKWSAESAGGLSNDAFFELLGIPELTNAKAARCMGHDAPLIMKRSGCHVWKPENFTEDDPRFGWTWDHCRADAIALLGSEAALEEYLKEPQPTADAGEEKFELKSEERGRQGRLF